MEQLTQQAQPAEPEEGAEGEQPPDPEAVAQQAQVQEIFQAQQAKQQKHALDQQVQQLILQGKQLDYQANQQKAQIEVDTAAKLGELKIIREAEDLEAARHKRMLGKL